MELAKIIELYIELVIKEKGSYFLVQDSKKFLFPHKYEESSKITNLTIFNENYQIYIYNDEDDYYIEGDDLHTKKQNIVILTSFLVDNPNMYYKKCTFEFTNLLEEVYNKNLTYWSFDPVILEYNLLDTFLENYSTAKNQISNLEDYKTLSTQNFFLYIVIPKIFELKHNEKIKKKILADGLNSPSIDTTFLFLFYIRNNPESCLLLRSYFNKLREKHYFHKIAENLLKEFDRKKFKLFLVLAIFVYYKHNRKISKKFYSELRGLDCRFQINLDNIMRKKSQINDDHYLEIILAWEKILFKSEPTKIIENFALKLEKRAHETMEMCLDLRNGNKFLLNEKKMLPGCLKKGIEAIFSIQLEMFEKMQLNCNLDQDIRHKLEIIDELIFRIEKHFFVTKFKHFSLIVKEFQRFLNLISSFKNEKVKWYYKTGYLPSKGFLELLNSVIHTARVLISLWDKLSVRDILYIQIKEESSKNIKFKSFIKMLDSYNEDFIQKEHDKNFHLFNYIEDKRKGIKEKPLVIICDGMPFTIFLDVWNELTKKFSLEINFELSAWLLANLPTTTEMNREGIHQRLNIDRAKLIDSSTNLSDMEKILSQDSPCLIFRDVDDALKAPKDEIPLSPSFYKDVIQSLIDKFTIVFKAIRSNNLKKTIIITSDHGYIETTKTSSFSDFKDDIKYIDGNAVKGKRYIYYNKLTKSLKKYLNNNSDELLQLEKKKCIVAQKRNLVTLDRDSKKNHVTHGGNHFFERIVPFCCFQLKNTPNKYHKLKLKFIEDKDLKKTPYIHERYFFGLELENRSIDQIIQDIVVTIYINNDLRDRKIVKDIPMREKRKALFEYYPSEIGSLKLHFEVSLKIISISDSKLKEDILKSHKKELYEELVVEKRKYRNKNKKKQDETLKHYIGL